MYINKQINAGRREEKEITFRSNFEVRILKKKEDKKLNTKRISSELQSVLEFHEAIFKQRRWQIGIV